MGLKRINPFCSRTCRERESAPSSNSSALQSRSHVLISIQTHCCWGKWTRWSSGMEPNDLLYVSNHGGDPREKRGVKLLLLTPFWPFYDDLQVTTDMHVWTTDGCLHYWQAHIKFTPFRHVLRVLSVWTFHIRKMEAMRVMASWRQKLFSVADLQKQWRF